MNPIAMVRRSDSSNELAGSEVDWGEGVVMFLSNNENNGVVEWVAGGSDRVGDKLLTSRPNYKHFVHWNSKGIKSSKRRILQHKQYFE